jgi:hypothetical protein
MSIVHSRNRKAQGMPRNPGAQAGYKIDLDEK